LSISEDHPKTGGAEAVKSFWTPRGSFHIRQLDNKKMGELDEEFPHFRTPKGVEKSQQVCLKS
jgi:hypothetical protein